MVALGFHWAPGSFCSSRNDTEPSIMDGRLALIERQCLAGPRCWISKWPILLLGLVLLRTVKFCFSFCSEIV
jgi:hypothetical protein